MESIRYLTWLGAIAMSTLALAVLGGCNVLDPSIAGTGMWDAERSGKSQTILENIIEDEQDNEPPNAEAPNDSDFKVVVQGYRIGPGDQISVTVPDLLALGAVYQHQAQISATGFLTLPNIGRLLVAGKTARQFEEKIAVILKGAKVLNDPQVTVQVLLARQQTFSILGPVARPGAYMLQRSNFTVLDALALAGTIGGGIDYIYVIRAPQDENLIPASDERQQIFARPQAGGMQTGNLPEDSGIPPDPIPAPVPAPSTVPGTGPLEGQPVAPPVLPAPTGNGGALIPWSQPAQPGTGVPGPTHFEPREVNPAEHGVATPWRWDASGGRFVAHGRRRPNYDVAAGGPGELVEAELAGAGARRRIVKINLKALRGGDPTQNIVLRKDDIVYVPPIEIGEFYMGGRVARVGVYTLTGRKLTVKMAIVAAGGVTSLADATRVDIVRRLGPNEEATIVVNLQDIWKGKAPNFYIKANDIVNVSEGWWNRPLAIVLNAFRMTYGFGFVYDKNFSDDDNRF